MLYVANPPAQAGQVGSILGFPAGANGNVSPLVRIAGPKTELSYNATSVAVDKLGRLYATGTNTLIGQVNIWLPGSNGDAAPIARLSGTCSDFTDVPMQLTVDRFDHLWVACSGEGSPDGHGGGGIAEFPILPAGFRGGHNGSTFASRYIYGAFPGFNNPASVAVKPSDKVSEESNAGLQDVLTFARTAKDQDAPLSSLGGNRTQLDGQGGISYDSGGRLVACTNRKHESRLLTFAPGATGNVAPISILNIASCKSIAVDPQDNIYVVSATSITEYSPGATGSAKPTRVISGDLTGLTNAAGIAFQK